MNRVEKELKKMQQMDDIIEEVKQLSSKIEVMQKTLEELLEKQSSKDIKKNGK